MTNKLTFNIPKSESGTWKHYTLPAIKPHSDFKFSWIEKFKMVLFQNLKDQFKDDHIKVWRNYLKEEPSWESLNFLYIQFLKGNLNRSLTHFGPLVDDTIEHGTDTLIEINQLGFISVDSQPGAISSGEWGIEKQRNYIVGYILEENINKIEKEFGGSNFYVSIRDNNNEIIFINSLKWTLPYTNSLPLTIDENDKIWTSLPLNKPKVFDLLSLQDHKELYKDLLNKTFYCEIVAKEYGKVNCIYSKLIKALS